MTSNKIIDFEQAKQNTLLRKKTLPELNILRVFLMFAVIAIHLLNIPISNLATGYSQQGRFFVMRAMLVFAVPGFLFLSMMMVSFSSADKKLALADYYGKKFVRIGIPYLLWSMAYQIILLITGNAKLQNILQPKSLFYLLMYGKSYEHLYFMIILLEFLLIAPLLLPIVRKIQHSWKAAFAFAFGSQIAIYLFNRFYLIHHFSMLQSTFLWYFSSGFMGLWFGLNYRKNFQAIRKHQNKIFILIALTGVVHSYYSRILWFQTWNDISFDTFPYTVNLHVYMLLCTLGLLLISNWVAAYPKNVWGKEKNSYRFFMWIAPLSYGIYLMHPAFTYLIRKAIVSDRPMIWWLVVIFGVPALAALCGKITEYLQHIPIISLAFGNGLIPKKNIKQSKVS